MKILKYLGLLLVCLAAVLIAVTAGNGIAQQDPKIAGLKAKRAVGVCPPFKLKDEQGNVIDPVNGINANVPYSPRQTCGAAGCHDYNKITQGFHFMQGKGEAVPPEMAERYLWVSSPGNYGGNWCSPAPLYRQLAAKTNKNARVIDMTSFEFVTATCGNCHPGGGPLEFDRDGKRYDLWMKDPKSGLQPGGDNFFDGDYYKARWSETGVIEADCLLCHLPEYDFKKRNAQLALLNFKWAATEASGLGKVTGAVANGQTPTVEYDLKKFDTNGNVAVLHIVPEPRNETCLTCHAKPDWKKRGASFLPRTDVHIAAGLRCVDCHAAGSKAADPRIREREAHQFGKGDCPSGWVRNDLDDTVRNCSDCHLKGWNNAPRVNHAWLPPLHLEKISCQTCHIPYRFVKSALVQASDAFVNAPYITPAGKRIWTFYDQQMNYWNHYGELEVFTTKDQPTDPTRPTLFVYKGKIYPGNRVHSMWVGFEENGKTGLNQLFMKDFFTM
jgi:nitrate/TMAO reductase-like tetraheme cytochrome c subunit